MLEIPDDLHPDCMSAAWLLGRWEGVGVGDYPSIEPYRFGQEVVFTYVPNQPHLTYVSRTWVLDDNGDVVEPADQESGYWRPQPDGTTEVLVSHSTGIIEIYLGQAESGKIELSTRGVLKTETAPDYRIGHRLYGLVQGRLMYVYEVSADGEQLQPRMSAELQRVAGALEAREPTLTSSGIVEEGPE